MKLNDELKVAVVVAAAVTVVVVSVAGLAGTAMAGGEDPKWKADANLWQGYTDNVRYAQPGPDVEGAWFTRANARLTRRTGSDSAWMPDLVTAAIDGRVFGESSTRDSVTLGGRAVYETDVADVFAGYGYTPQRLRLEDRDGGDDVHYSKHAVVFGVERKFGVSRAWRVRALYERDRDEYESDNDPRDSEAWAGRLGLRWHYHDLFIPRAYFKYVERDAVDDNYDREDVRIEVGFDSKLPAGVEASLRYRRSDREYVVAGASGPFGSNSNFGRTDDIDTYRVGLELPLPWVDGLVLEMNYKYRTSSSSRTSRNYHVNEYGLGLAWGFSSKSEEG